MKLEVISSCILLIISTIFIFHNYVSIPRSLESLLMIILFVAFGVFAVFALKEKSKDEREALHILTASRISYMVGVGLLVTGIIVQAIDQQVDLWLVLTLCAMLITKLIARFYAHKKM